MQLRSTRVVVRGLRWLICGALVAACWACNAPKLLAPPGRPATVINKTFDQAVTKKLDLLFVVDNSISMLGSQAKLARRLPDFMKTLTDLPGGLPDLHLAVVSSSMGAGNFGNVTGAACLGGSPVNDDGSFQRATQCPALRAGERFIKAGPGGSNFTGPIGDLFSCVATLGAKGCGFEQQFASMRRALERAADPLDPENGGFLRPDAFLGVVMLTNEDDCSAPPESDLFDPRDNAISAPLGALQSYRCNEFGHLCDGQAPPHDVTDPTTLHNCVPADARGKLIPVATFVEFLTALKGGDASKILVAALAGAPSPYVVEKQVPPGGSDLLPTLVHSCTGSSPAEFADPAIRIDAWVKAFAGQLADICADDYEESMRKIAAAIGKIVQPACIAGDIRNRRTSETPDCQVTEVIGNVRPGTSLPFCALTPAVFPCWQLVDAPGCQNGKLLRVCREITCDPLQTPAGAGKLEISCSIEP